MNRLLSKGISNIYSVVTIETFLKIRFSGLKKFVTRSVFGELQLLGLGILGLGTKLYVAFLLFWFSKEL